jgi:hypothetical protein
MKIPSPDDDEGGVGGLNHTPHWVKPLVMVTMFHVFRFYILFMLIINVNLGVPPRTFGNQCLLKL